MHWNIVHFQSLIAGCKSLSIDLLDDGVGSPVPVPHKQTHTYYWSNVDPHEDFQPVGFHVVRLNEQVWAGCASGGILRHPRVYGSVLQDVQAEDQFGGVVVAPLVLVVVDPRQSVLDGDVEQSQEGEELCEVLDHRELEHLSRTPDGKVIGWYVAEMLVRGVFALVFVELSCRDFESMFFRKFNGFVFVQRIQIW